MGDFDVMGHIEAVVGAEAALKLAEAFAGTVLYIPRRVLVNRRKERMRREYAAGAGYRELARRYGYAERTVRRILDRGGRGLPKAKDARQKELFGL